MFISLFFNGVDRASNKIVVIQWVSIIEIDSKIRFCFGKVKYNLTVNYNKTNCFILKLNIFCNLSFQIH